MELKSVLKKSLHCLLIAGLYCQAGCMLLGGGGEEPAKGDQEILFTEGEKAMEAKDYEQAIGHFQTFTDQFPKSKQYTWALQRLGESYEGLLTFYYKKKIEAGKPEPEARRAFLEKYGRYKCWTETPDELQYNRMQYKLLLEKHPKSDIADEAAYRMIVWEKDYKGKPEGVLREIAELEKVLSQYPDTSLKPEILYKTARRYRTLYEMYAFSKKTGVRNPEKSEQYRAKTKFAYQLCLDSADRSDYGQKAWEEIEAFEQGRRIYIRE
jgi:outer membrane protein assembly factor BamD (BamD/ComL family)